MKVFRGFIWLAPVVAVALIGCSANTALGPASCNSVRQTGYGLIGCQLSRELARFGCRLGLKETPLAQIRSGWMVDRDAFGATVWLEGNHARLMLDEFKKKFGEPAYLNLHDSNGYLSFSYRKDQCGVIINCGVEPRAAWGLNAPLTCVTISKKLAPIL